MRKFRILLVSAVCAAGLIVPAQTAHAQYCQPDDFDPGCRAQQTCEKLASKTQLVSCTQ